MFYTLLSLVLSYRFALFTLSPKTCFLVAYLVVSSLYSQSLFSFAFLSLSPRVVNVERGISQI